MIKKCILIFCMLFLAGVFSGGGEEAEKLVDLAADSLVDLDDIDQKYTLLNDSSYPVTVIPLENEDIISSEGNASGSSKLPSRVLEKRGEETTYRFFASNGAAFAFDYAPKDRVDVVVYKKEAIFKDR